MTPTPKRPPVKLNPLSNATKIPLGQAIQMLNLPGNPTPLQSILQASTGPPQNLSN